MRLLAVWFGSYREERESRVNYRYKLNKFNNDLMATLLCWNNAFYASMQCQFCTFCGLDKEKWLVGEKGHIFGIVA